MARRQQFGLKALLQRFQARAALLPCRELARFARIVVMLPGECYPGEETTMRWKISRHGHDPRQIDLLALAVLIVAIIAAWGYLAATSDQAPDKAAFIVPGQSVRW
jgi:hypothetical protein